MISEHSNAKILVACRSGLPSSDFVPWPRSGEYLTRFLSTAQWMERSKAEVSSEVIQLIPSALVRDPTGHYCVFRRIATGNVLLTQRLSLVVGGHIDSSGMDQLPLLTLLEETLRRELFEEIHLKVTNSLAPIGIVVDHRSIESSRHVGIMYEAIVHSSKLTVRAIEEFLVDSHITGRFISAERLASVKHLLDPWSSILVEHQ